MISLAVAHTLTHTVTISLKSTSKTINFTPLGGKSIRRAGITHYGNSTRASIVRIPPVLNEIILMKRFDRDGSIDPWSEAETRTRSTNQKTNLDTAPEQLRAHASFS